MVETNSDIIKGELDRYKGIVIKDLEQLKTKE